jgi:hypothetical protein
VRAECTDRTLNNDERGRRRRGGVLTNGSAHGLAHGFSVLGYHVTGSGTVYLYGIAVGANARLGLWLPLVGARGTSSPPDHLGPATATSP